MARVRQLGPSFWMDEDIADLTPWARLLFQGLWSLADRRGRLEDRPAFIRVQVFPYDDLESKQVSLVALLEELARDRKHSAGGFIIRYEVAGRQYIQIRSFEKHQHPHPKEPESKIPVAPTVTEKPRKAAESRGGQRPGRGQQPPCRAGSSVPSVPSGSSEPSDIGLTVRPSAVGPPAESASVKAIVPANGAVKKRPPTWLTPFGDAWRERWGQESEPPWGEMAAALDRPYREMDRDELGARWKRFLAAAQTSQWARPARFVQGLGEWAEGARPRAGPSKASGTETMAALERFKARRQADAGSGQGDSVRGDADQARGRLPTGTE